MISNSSPPGLSGPAPSVPVKPLATRSLHADFLEKSIPRWLTDASTQRRRALKGSHTVLPSWYRNASPARRKALDDSSTASLIAQNRLDKTLSSFQDIEAFARPLLLKALREQYQVQVDVDNTLLCLRRPLQVGILAIELSSFEVLKLSMLDAALHNFEADECRPGAYHETSGFVVVGTSPDTFHAVTVNVSVSQFLSLCRHLDIGKQYQTYLRGFFHPTDAVAATAFRQQFIASQKAAMRAAAELALLKEDIEPAHYAMIVSVINDELNPSVGHKPVWFRDLAVMDKRLTGCVVFSICEKYRYSNEWVFYIPHDPEHPFKCYRGDEATAEFKRLLTARHAGNATSAEPTDYQRFLSQFLPYEARGYYFSQFTRKAADSPSDYWRSPWRTILDLGAGAAFTRIRELPPPPAAKLEPEPDPYIAPSIWTQRRRGLWEENQNLWEYLYTESCAKVLADARSHAVPSADVDVRARDAKLAHLLQIGMLGLNMVSMFVPVLGEVMMVVMAGQLLYETLEGAVEWGEGDRRAAKDHLLDVAENLAQIAVMAGVGVGVRRFSAARPEPVIEQLHPVTLPNGETRLWKPDLSAYESSVVLDANAMPNEAGQYEVGTQTFIRQGDRVFEQFFDESLGKWRIRHPSDTTAYQPILGSNGRGAWRHTLERPLEWDRLTLLRRLGHETDGFSDAELIRIADVSGVSDNALRKMHVDHAVPPPALTDALRLFRADAGVDEVIEQLRGTRPINEKYLYALPLMTDLPTWPSGRVLEVFEGPQLSGASVKYGERWRVPGVDARLAIRLTRSQVLGGELNRRIVASLDQAELGQLLRGRGPLAPDARAPALGELLAEYASGRQSAIFDSLYAGTPSRDRQVTLLQRTCPGLSESAAQEVLHHAAADDLERLAQTRRVPLRMLEEARWYARQGRQTRAYAGLRSDNQASADSRRLALQMLQRMPGWPDNVRLEVRDGSTTGALLDSIGDVPALHRKFLIKNGPQFQAFDERGEALNSLSREGDNFYASILHALPDDARRSLGIPHVGQGADLQSRIIEQAGRNRADVLQALEPQAKLFKPPVRVNETLVGYYASGRGQAFNPPLTAKVRDVYPGLSDAQANEFIRQQSQAGLSEGQIYSELLRREQEWAAQKATLEAWIGTPEVVPRDPFGRPMPETAQQRRRNTAQAFETSWRAAPLAAQEPRAARLEIDSEDLLPTLTADFSHVRELSVSGSGLTDANADGFLARFQGLEKLRIGSRSELFRFIRIRIQELTNLPRSVSRMTTLKSLSYASHMSLPADFAPRLAPLTALEALEIKIYGTDTVFPERCLASLVNLRTLTLNAPHMTQWPVETLDLPALERFDLSNTAIRSIPEAFYTGHEKQWAGLSLNWRKVAYEDFTRACEYVKSHEAALGHLMDVEQMVRSYVQGELEFLMGIRGYLDPLPERLLNLDLEAIQALSVEYAEIFRPFHEPIQSSGLRTARLLPLWNEVPNSSLLKALQSTWRNGVSQRYGVPVKQALFELPPADAYLSLHGSPRFKTLPVLPAGAFDHVKTVRLRELDVPAEHIRGFVQAFSEAQSLEIADTELTEVPIFSADLPQLTRLNLAGNSLSVTPVVQHQLNALTNIEDLDLSHNPLGQLDLGALTRLKTVNLRATRLKAWPRDAENMAGLTWIDLRDNALARLPEQVLAHPDTLIKVNLTGNPFTADSASDLTTALHRIETAQGLPAGTLQRFAQESVPEVFPPSETGWSVKQGLLPLPRHTSAPADTVGFAARLQALDPLLSPQRALQHIAHLRNAGLSDLQIEGRLNDWKQTGETLAVQLNGWLYIREFQTSRRFVSAQSRSLAAKQIYRCWLDGLIAPTQENGQVLDLMKAQTGDLPALPVQFPAVTRLLLTGVRITEQGSNGFLRAFPAVDTLVLDGNDLEAIPDAVRGMSRLERLELNSNRFTDPRTLYETLRGERLRWLDVSNNQLDTFDVSAFGRLETLNLAYNGLHAWPVGALESEYLHTLDVRGNHLQMIPAGLFDGGHEMLARGTRLEENSQLSRDSLERLRDYSIAHGDGDVMGISRNELDLRIAAANRHPDSSSESGSNSDSEWDSDSEEDLEQVDPQANVEELESIDNPATYVAQDALEPWLANTTGTLRDEHAALWRQLAEADGYGPFFHLLWTLRDTSDFILSRAHLSFRVWEVIRAAAENSELRQKLFFDAQTHATCADGRSLSFSEMETRVFKYNALRDVPRWSSDRRGRALLDLSRQMFRLEQVDRLAERAALGEDRAEIRLQYRIGMTAGWPDGLELPGQPQRMLYGTPIHGQALLDARRTVLETEASDEFLRNLVLRDYWVRYLVERNPETFATLEQNATRRQIEVEDTYPDWQGDALSTEQYQTAMNRLEIELTTARNEKLIELSRGEITRLATVDGPPQQARPASPQPGPSWRP